MTSASAGSSLPLSIALRHAARNRSRLLVTLAGVSVAVFLMAFQGSLLAGFVAASGQVIATIGGDVWVVPRGVTCFDFTARLSRSRADVLVAHPSILRINPVVGAFTVLTRSDGQHRAVLMVGAPDWLSDWPMNRSRRVGPSSLAVDASAVALLGADPVPSPVEFGGMRATVSTVVTGFGGFLGSPHVFGELKDVQRLLRVSSDDVSYLAIDARSGVDVSALREDIARRLPEFDVYTRADLARRAAVFWLIQTGAGGGILTAGILGFVVGLAVVSQTLFASTMEALPEFATLRAIGASRTTLCGFVMTQAAVIGIAGGLLGLALTWPLAGAARSYLVPWVHLEWWLATLAFLAGVLMCAAASVVSIRRAIGVDPASVFRG